MCRAPGEFCHGTWMHTVAWASSVGCATTSTTGRRRLCGNVCRQSHLLHPVGAKPRRWPENVPKNLILWGKKAIPVNFRHFTFGSCNYVVTLPNVCLIKMWEHSEGSQRKRTCGDLYKEFLMINLYSFIYRSCPQMSILWYFYPFFQPPQHCLVLGLLSLFSLWRSLVLPKSKQSTLLYHRVGSAAALLPSNRLTVLHNNELISQQGLEHLSHKLLTVAQTWHGTQVSFWDVMMGFFKRPTRICFD